MVDDRDREHALTAHPQVGRRSVVDPRVVAGRQQDPAHDLGVDRVAVVVGIGVHDDEVVRELAGHVGVVAAALLGAEVDAVAAGVAWQRPHHGIGRGVDDQDGRRQRGGGDHVLAVRGHRGLDGQSADEGGTAAARIERSAPGDRIVDMPGMFGAGTRILDSIR